MDKSRWRTKTYGGLFDVNKIEARGGVSQSPQSVPVQQPVPQPTYQQPQNFPPPVDANGNTKDDLPF
nr:hypothetical protein [Bacteroides sp. 14(A)]